MKTKEKPRLIIDCSGVIYTAFYTFGALSNEGENTGIIYGFFKKILTYAEKFETNKFYFCFDHKVSHRKGEFELYKANREKKQKELTQLEKKEHESRFKQSQQLRDSTLFDFGFRNIFWQEGYEGDDFMALIAKRFEDKNPIIITADNDLFQCLNYCTIANPINLKITTKESFEKIYKVDPSQWPICKSIGGCDGDNVIGINGVGDPKKPSSKALKYIRKEIKKGAIYDRIISDEGKKIIKRNLSLVTLPYKPHKMNRIKICKNEITKMSMIKTFSKFGFKSMLERDVFKRWENIFL